MFVAWATIWEALSQRSLRLAIAICIRRPRRLLHRLGFLNCKLFAIQAGRQLRQEIHFQGVTELAQRGHTTRVNGCKLK